MFRLLKQARVLFVWLRKSTLSKCVQKKLFHDQIDEDINNDDDISVVDAHSDCDKDSIGNEMQIDMTDERVENSDVQSDLGTSVKPDL